MSRTSTQPSLPSITSSSISTPPGAATANASLLSDVDWVGCLDTRRSTTGWSVYLGDALISWKCKKQERVSKSSTEAEYRAMSSACPVITWLRGLLSELGYPKYGPTPLHADKTSAIQIVSNPVFHEHIKHIELDAAAPVLAKLDKPIVIAKVDADKFRRFASRFEIDGFPTLKIFIHGVPMEYVGPRKADLLVQFLKKFVAPDVSILESDAAISSFLENAGTDFPIYIGFGMNESVISEVAIKYKKKAWFSVAKEFSEDVRIAYDFDKVPTLISIHPKYNERSIFYGPFEDNFLEDFVKQNLLPLSIPINYDTLKLLNDDERKIVVTIVEDETDEKSLKLVKLLRAAASANRDLVFGYFGVKQWEDFADTFEVNKKTKLPKMIVWDRNEEYVLVVGSESLDEEDQGSQITRFLEGYREGRTVQKKISGPSFIGFLNSLIGIRTVYIIVFLVGVFMLIQHITRHDDDDDDDDDIPQRGKHKVEDDASGSVAPSESRQAYQPGDKED